MAAHSEEDLEEYLLPSGNPPPPPDNDDLGVPSPSPAVVEPLTEERRLAASQRPDASQIHPKTLDFGNHEDRPTKAPIETRHVLIEKVTQTQPTTHVADPRAAQPLDNLAQDARQLETEIELEPLTQEPAAIAFDFDVAGESEDLVPSTVNETLDNPQNSYSDEDSIQPQKMADDALNLGTSLQQQLPALVEPQSPADGSRFVDLHLKSSVGEDSHPSAQQDEQQQQQQQQQLEPREAPQEPTPKTHNVGISSTTSTEKVSAEVNDVEEIVQRNPQSSSETQSAAASKTGEEESSSVRIILPSATNENEGENANNDKPAAQHEQVEKEGTVSRESPPPPPPNPDGNLVQNDDDDDDDNDSPIIQRSRACPSPDNLGEGDDDMARAAAAENNDADTSPDRDAPLRKIMSQAREYVSDEEQIEREIRENVGRGRGRLLSHLRRPSSDSSEAESSEDGVEEVLVTRPSTQKDDSDDSIIIQSVRGPSLTPEKRTPVRRSRRINPVAIELDDDDDSDEVLVVDVTPTRRSAGQSSDDSVPRLSRTTRAEVEADMDSDTSDGNDWLNVRARAGRTVNQSPTKRREKRKPKRQRVSIISDEEDDDSEVLRPSKRRHTRSRPERKQKTTSKRRVIEISSDDSQVRYRPRKRQRRPRIQTRKGVGYRRDGFVVSDASDVYDSSSSAEAGDPDDDDDGYDNDEGDVSESDEEEEDFANVSSSMRKVMKKALKGRQLPFRGGLICTICRWTGAPVLGTAANGYRDGFIQPLSNFSANVRRGNYGVRMQEPFCLSHTAGDQNEYVRRLALTAERNKSLYDSESRSEEDEEEEEEEENNSNSVTEVISDDDSPMNSNNTPRGRKENVELSAEKVLLNVPGKESNEAIMHGAEYDWHLSTYVAMPGTNLAPLKKWIIEEID